MPFQITVTATEISEMYRQRAGLAREDAEQADATADLIKRLRQGPQGQKVGFDVSAPEIRAAAIEIADEFEFIAEHAEDPLYGDAGSTVFHLTLAEARELGLLPSADKPLGAEARSIGYVRRNRG